MKKTNVIQGNNLLQFTRLSILCCCMFLLLFTTNKVFATNSSFIQQDISIEGTITSTNGEPLPGASIVVKGTKIGAVSDFDGKYKLSVPQSSEIVLVVSYLGYVTKEAKYEGNSTINVTLEEDATGLDEVVIVGYGGVKKSDLTGSVSTVKAEEISAFPTNGIAQAIQGRTSGVQISSNNAGEPGGRIKVRIRGTTSINSSSDPLYVVDGFPGGIAPPPEDIASIEILKDASATAIYGSRGANGVVMITTKKGASGKPRIELNTSYSIQNVSKSYDLLNAQQMAEYINDVSVNNGSTIVYPDAATLGVGTDWQDLVFNTGSIKNHQISVSGGTENVKYYVSGGMYDHEGVIINSDYKRYNIISNVDITASKKFKFGANLYYKHDLNNGIRSQEDGGGSTPGVIGSALRFEPMLGVFNDDGVYNTSQLGAPYDNPVAVANELVNEYLGDNFQGNFYGEYKIIPELTFKTTLGFQTQNGRSGYYSPSILLQSQGVNGSGALSYSKNTDLISENYLTFTKDFGIHNLSIMGGYSYQSYKGNSNSARGTGFINDNGSYWALSQASNAQPPSAFYVDSKLASFYGRLNYKFSDKYLFTFNARYDGSSRFAKNNKWAFFPSGAFAWNVSNEEFLKNNETISQLKLRLSYGITGNQAIGSYQSLANFGSVLTIINGQIVNAIRPTSFENANLTWESTEQKNLGVDIGFLNNKISLTLDYYDMVTSDLLFSQPLPQYSGISSRLSNIGKVGNKGIEIGISTRNISTDKFKWTTDFNISTNKNEILELPNNNQDIRYGSGPGHMVGIGDTQILKVGEPIGAFYGYVYDGVLQSDSEALVGNFEQTAGGEKFKDLDGDGKITPNDRTIIGNPTPKFIWGLNNSFSYGDFDLNLFFQGSQGNDIYSYTLMELDLMGGYNNATTNALNRWTPTNTNTNVPIARSRGRVSSSRFVYDGSYMRLKNVAFGYSLPKEVLSTIKLSSVRFTLSAQNLFTITDYPGMDPEVNYRSFNTTSETNMNAGLDYASYPNVKSYTIGLKVGF